MNIAFEEAREGISKGHGGPFGAVIVKDGEIIAQGHNHVVANNDPTCHGEIDAIRKACSKLGTFDLTGCELYTSGYPCPMCLSAIIWANIKKVYFSCNPVDAENIGFRDDFIYRFIEESCGNKETLELVECDRENGLKLFEEYTAIQDKTHY
jgi:tRNA(Arg) A34 adenosine deaminase TadA